MNASMPSVEHDKLFTFVFYIHVPNNLYVNALTSYDYWNQKIITYRKISLQSKLDFLLDVAPLSGTGATFNIFQEIANNLQYKPNYYNICHKFLFSS